MCTVFCASLCLCHLSFHWLLKIQIFIKVLKPLFKSFLLGLLLLLLWKVGNQLFVCSFIVLWIVDCGVVWIGRELERSSTLIALQRAGTSPPLGCSELPWRVPREGTSTLSNLFHCLTNFIVKKSLPLCLV